MHALRTGPDAVAPLAPVVRHRVNRVTGEVRPSDIPRFATLVCAKDERTLHRADEEKDVAFFRFDVTDRGHRANCTVFKARSAAVSACELHISPKGDTHE